MTPHQWLVEWSVWGWPWLANHLWQATLFSTTLFIVIVLLNRAPARARYSILLLASLKFAVPSALLVYLALGIGLDLASLLHPSRAVSEPSPTILIISQVAEPIRLTADPVVAVGPQLPTTHNETYCLLTVVWFIGFIVFFGLWLMRRVRFSLALRLGNAIGLARESEILERVQTRLGINKEVRLILSPQALETGVWGTWRPVIVLPEGIANRLDDDELEAVLMHELVHVGRWDNLVSDLQMLLCCVFWFHPLVWLIDRKVLAERERACDEQVIELGGSPQIYAKSLLKVFQVGLSWKMAGVSCATGSNLRRRIERIMTSKESAKLVLSHRLAIGACVCALIVFSLTVGLFAQGKVAAKKKSKPAQAVVGGVPGGIEGGVPGGVPGGVVGGVPGGVVGGVVGGVPGGVVGGVEGGIPGALTTQSDGQENASQDVSVKKLTLLLKEDPLSVITGRGSFYTLDDKRMEQLVQMAQSSPDWPLSYENPAGAPLMISSATAKVVTHEQYDIVRGVVSAGGQPSVDAFTIRPTVHLINSSNKRIVEFSLVLANENSSWRLVANRKQRIIEPGGDYTFELAWPVLLPGSASGVTVKVNMVQFEDGSSWYGSTLVQNEDDELRNIRFLELQKALTQIDGAGKNFSKPRITFTPRPEWTEEARVNKVSGTVVLSALFGADGVVRDVRVVKSLGYGLDEKAVEAAEKIEFIPATGPDGQPAQLRSTVTVEFSSLGAQVVELAQGDLQRFAVNKVSPIYPPIARAARIEGPVQVEITVDRDGTVITANVIEGHPLLRNAAIDAALQWKFKPHEVDGVPTRTSGKLIFYFKL